MDLKKNISDFTNQELVELLEHSNEFQEFLVEKANSELQSRSLGVKELRELARPVYRAKLRKLFNKKAFILQKVPLPSSRFLIKSQTEKIYMEEVHHWKIYKDNSISGAKDYWG